MNDIVHPSLGRVAIAPLARPEPRARLHCAIFLDRNEVLDDKVFRLVGLQGQESVSEPFELDLELHGNTDPSAKAPPRFDQILGRPATVGIALGAKGILPELFHKALKTVTAAQFQQDYGAELSVFNGIVAAFAMEAPGVYRMTLRPALWKLTLTNRYTVHRSMSIKDAIAGVMREHGVEFSTRGIEGSHSLAATRTQDWLQAGETDYEFVRRLMSKAHIHYYFEHAGSAHRTILSSRAAYPKVYEDGRALRYTYSSADELGMEQDDVVSQYAYKQSLVSSGVSSVFARQGAAWEQDPIASYQTYYAPRSGAPGKLPFNLYKVYQYGLSETEVEHYTAQTARALDTSGVQLSGSSFCPRLRVGYQFKVCGTVRPEIDGRAFVLTKVQHQASLDGGYKNDFEATGAARLITPFSVQETQQGNVLARVMPAPGPAGGTAPSTWRYYEKTGFESAVAQLQDTQAQPPSLDARGVYVRFATETGSARPRDVWVKLAPHMTAVPEIGTMVLVSRANDESELPEIQSVQANGSFTVTPLRWTANTHVGSSYSTTYGDSKRVSYGESSKTDLDQAMAMVEKKYTEGKNGDKFKESSYSQGASYGYSTAEKGRDGTLSVSDSFGSTYNTHSAKETRSESDVGYAYSKSKTGTVESINDVTGTSTSTATHGGKVSSTTTINADSENTSTITGTALNTSTHNIVHNNSTANAQSSSSATGASNSNEAVGVSNSNSATGVANRNSVTGASAEVSLVGASSSVSLVGASTSLHAALTSMQLSNVLTSRNVSMTGVSAAVEILGAGVVFKNKPAAMTYELSGTELSLLSAIKMIL